MATTDLDTVADRLALLRHLTKHQTDAAFADWLGLSSPQRWNNYLRGSPLPNPIGLILCQKIPGLTLDWIYRGRTEALTVDLAQRIEEAEAVRKGTTSRRPKEAR